MKRTYTFMGKTMTLNKNQRDRKSLNNIRRYIINNPTNWTEDKNYVN